MWIPPGPAAWPFLPVEGDESKVLGFIVLALVHWSDHLGHGTKWGEVCLNVLIADSLWRKVTQIDLALLGLGRRLDPVPDLLGSLGSEVGQDQILWEPLSPDPGPNTSTASLSES